MTARIGGIEEEELQHLYSDHHASIQQIADYYDVGHGTIKSRMKEYNIKIRSVHDANKGNCYARRLYVNRDFFKTWTPQSAWLFGWFYGDGSRTTPYRTAFILSQKDREVLEKMKQILMSEHKITDYKSWNKTTQKYYSFSRLQIPSKEIVDDLKDISFYGVDDEYFSHMLRGFFEAEGSVFWTKDSRLAKGGIIGTSISQKDYDLMIFIRRSLRELGIVEGGAIWSFGTVWQLGFGMRDSISLYHYLYDDCGNMFLKRKKERFEELIRLEMEVKQ